jgi:hypothetical protein
MNSTTAKRRWRRSWTRWQVPRHRRQCRILRRLDSQEAPQTLRRARDRRPEDRHHRCVTNDTPELASPGPNIKFTDDVAAITKRSRQAEGRGRQQDHRADPCRLHQGSIRHRQDPRCRRRRRRPLAHAAVEHRPEGSEGPYPTMVDNPGGYKVPVVRPPPTASISATWSSPSTTTASSRKPRAIRS